MTNRLFPSSSRSHTFRSKLTIALAVPFLALAAFGQAPATWKTITNKETGVSVLMPPGAAFKTDTSGDAKTGEKVITLQSQVQTEGADGYFYIVEAVRMNAVAVEGVRQAFPTAKDPISVLVDTALKPFLGTVGKASKEHPKTSTITRKPIVSSGLQGEDITVTENSGKNKGSFGKLRALRNSNGFYIVFGGERKNTPQTVARLNKVLASLTVTADAPFAEPAPTTPTPTNPAPVAPIPAQPVPAQPVMPPTQPPPTQPTTP